jgi:transcriptional regulator CtsR
MYILQIDSLNQVTSSYSGDILAFVSISVTLLIGVFAIIQSYHYYSLTKITNSNTNNLLTKLNEIEIRLETVNTLMQNKFLEIFGKTMGQVTKGAFSNKGVPNADNLKKDLEKTITDSSDKIEGQIKGLTDSLDKNQLNISEIKTSLEVVANAVQDVFNNVINNIDDFDECSDEGDYLKTKIIERCNTDVKLTVKDILNSTSPKISIDKKMDVIKRLKDEKIINYPDGELFSSTVVYVERDLN